MRIKYKTILTDSSVILSLPNEQVLEHARAMLPSKIEKNTTQMKCALPRTKLLYKKRGRLLRDDPKSKLTT